MVLNIVEKLDQFFCSSFGCSWILSFEISTYSKASLLSQPLTMVFVVWCGCWNFLQIKFAFTSLIEFKSLFPQLCTRIVWRVSDLMFDRIQNKSLHRVKWSISIRTIERCNTFEMQTQKEFNYFVSWRMRRKTAPNSSNRHCFNQSLSHYLVFREKHCGWNDCKHFWTWDAPLARQF